MAFPEEELKGAGGKAVGRGIPTNVGGGVERVSDMRDGGSENVSVEASKEKGKNEGNKDQEEMEATGAGGRRARCSMR